jgi:predicted amidohydrolase
MAFKHSEISRREFMGRSGLAVTGMVTAGASPVFSKSDSGVSSNRYHIDEKGKGTLRVAACQILNYPDVEKSTKKIMHWIETAAKDGVDVIAFPEACLCGYAGNEYWKTARPADFEKAEGLVIEASKRLNIAVVLGTVHWESWPVPGKILPVYKLAGVKSCFIICHDVRYPELVRLPAVAGAQICYFCSHESGLKHEHKLSAYRAMPIARATENSIFCVMANAPADPKTLRGSHGNSKIIHPDGNVLVEAGYFKERLVTANINVSDASRSIARRSAKDNTILKQWLNEGTKLVRVYD